MQLRKSLAQLEVTPARGAGTSDLAGKVLNQKFVFPGNEQKLESVSLNSNDEGKSMTLVVRLSGQDMNLPAGFGHWQKGVGAVPAGRPGQFRNEPLAGTLAWTGNDTLEVKVCAYETPFHFTFRLKFDGERVTLDREANVAFGPRKQGTLVGRLQ